MKKYIRMELEIIRFSEEDVIKTSGELPNVSSGEDELPIVPWSGSGSRFI